MVAWSVSVQLNIHHYKSHYYGLLRILTKTKPLILWRISRKAEGRFWFGWNQINGVNRGSRVGGIVDARCQSSRVPECPESLNCFLSLSDSCESASLLPPDICFTCLRPTSCCFSFLFCFCSVKLRFHSGISKFPTASSLDLNTECILRSLFLRLQSSKSLKAPVPQNRH